MRAYLKISIKNKFRTIHCTVLCPVHTVCPVCMCNHLLLTMCIVLGASHNENLDQWQMESVWKLDCVVGDCCELQCAILSCYICCVTLYVLICAAFFFLCSFIAFLYFLQMLALTTALSLAIRPGVTDETLIDYNTPLDQFRAFVEAVVILMWIVKIGNEVFKLIV